MGILRDAQLLHAMKIIIIVIAVCLAVLRFQTATAQQPPQNRATLPPAIGMHVHATVVDGLHVTGYVFGLLLSDIQTGAATYQIEVYGSSLSGVSLEASGNLKSTPCWAIRNISVPPVKQTRYCGIHTTYTTAAIQFIQEVL